MSPGDAQRRVQRIRAFQEELRELEQEGAIALTPEQRSRLDAHLDSTLVSLAARFDVDTTESGARISWGMRIASTLGAFALCAAVFLFFYRYWGLIPDAAQVAIVIATPLIALAGAEIVSRRERTPYFTGLLSLIALAGFVLNLTVLGAIFNITPSPHAFAALGLFAIILAYHYGIRLLLAAGLVSSMIWLSALVAMANGLYWESVSERGESFIIGGIIALALSHRQRPSFRWVYELVGLLAIFLPMVALALGAQSYLPIGQRTSRTLYELAGLSGTAVTIWRGIRSFAPAWVNVGATFFTLLLLVTLFDWWWDVLPKYLFFLLIGLIAVALVTAFKKLRSRVEESRTT